MVLFVALASMPAIIPVPIKIELIGNVVAALGPKAVTVLVANTFAAWKLPDADRVLPNFAAPETVSVPDTVIGPDTVIELSNWVAITTVPPEAAKNWPATHWGAKPAPWLDRIWPAAPNPLATDSGPDRVMAPETVNVLPKATAPTTLAAPETVNRPPTVAVPVLNRLETVVAPADTPASVVWPLADKVLPNATAPETVIVPTTDIGPDTVNELLNVVAPVTVPPVNGKNAPATHWGARPAP